MRVAVRTERYRMDVTWWRDGKRLAVHEADGILFDLQEDPGEVHNLWRNPVAQRVVADLWGYLEAWDASLDRPAALSQSTRG